MIKMKKIITIMLLVVVLATSMACTACTTNETVNLAGSSALLPLVEIAIPLFNKVEGNEDILVTVNGGGSGTGLSQIAAGTIDIGNSDLFAEEKLTAAQCEGLVDNKLCIISMALVVSEEVPVTNLSTEDIKGIFDGTITNWSDIDGCDYEKAIMVCTRPDGSGTKATFDKYVLGGESTFEGGFENDNSGEIADKLEEADNAIAYLALSYLVNNDDIKTVSIDGVAPTYANCYNGTYAPWAYEHMYTKGEPKGAIKAFIDFMMGDAFASEIEKAGYGLSTSLTQKALDTRK